MFAPESLLNIWSSSSDSISDFLAQREAQMKGKLGKWFVFAWVITVLTAVGLWVSPSVKSEDQAGYKKVDLDGIELAGPSGAHDSMICYGN